MSYRRSVERFVNPQELQANRKTALAVYRYLLQSIGLVFKNDLATKRPALRLAREQFQQHRTLGGDSAEALRGLQHAVGVAKILRENVVQGRSVGDDTWKLDIHEETQRGENATAAKMKGTTKSFKDIKNSQF